MRLIQLGSNKGQNWQAGWKNEWMTTMGECFMQKLCGVALSHDLTIPLFILLPHKVKHKNLRSQKESNVPPQ